MTIEPLAFVQADPRGWNILDAAVNRSIQAGAPQQFSVNLQAGQAISASLKATTSPATLTLTDPNGTVISLVNLNGGQTGFLNPYIAPTAGSWTVTVSNTGAATANYSLIVALGAGLEGADSTDASPRALDNTYTTLTGGSSRYAFLGTSDTGSGADTDVYTLDLTGKVGTAIDVRLTGSGVDLTGQTLELLRPDGTVLATATANAGHAQDASKSLLISGVIVPTAGVYKLRFTSNVSGDYGLVVSDTATADPISASQLLSLIVSQGWTTKTTVNQLLSTLTFERVHQSMSTDQLLRTLVSNQLTGSYTDLYALKNAIAARGINLTPFRPDGVLTALATAPGGSLLTSNGAPLTASQAKAALQTAFNASATNYLSVLASNQIINLFDDSITTTAGAQVKRFYAISTKTVASGYDNLIVGFPLWYGPTHSSNLSPQLALAATSLMPAGHRDMHLNDFAELVGYYGGVYPDSGYIDGVDAQGNPSAYYLVWMDQWQAAVQSRVTSFFTQYKALGGQLDTLAMDIETTGLTYWDIQQYDRRVDTSSGNLPSLTFWQTLLQDSRWPALKSQLLAAGIPDAQLQLGAINNWDVHSTYASMWNAVMEARLTDYINVAITQPVLALFPNARISNYSSHYRTQTIAAGQMSDVTGSYYSIGAIVGNRQSRELYGEDTYVTTPSGSSQPAIPFETRVKQISFAQNRDAQNNPLASGVATITFFAPITGLRVGDQINVENRGIAWIDAQYTGKQTIASISADGLRITYNMTLNSPSSVPAARDLTNRANTMSTAFVEFYSPYNVFVSEVKLLRTQVAAASTPLLPWIADRDWQQTYNGDDWTYYTENIFHAALSGAEDFLWWKYDWAPDPANSAVVANALKELDPLVGYADRKTITLTGADWGDGYVLTGMDANGKRVFRLTPDPRQSVTILSSSGTVRIQIGSQTLEFANASIYTPANPASTFGYWIVQTAGTNQLTQSASQIIAALQSLLKPQVAVSGGIAGQATQFTLNMNSAAFASSTVFAFDIDWTGDGVVDQIVTGTSGRQVTGVYNSTGSYNFVVTASVLGTGETLPTMTRSFQVFGANTPPVVPTSLAAVASGPQLTLSWQAGSANVQQFKIFRFNGANYIEIASLSASATSYQDTNLAPSTTYFYAIRAISANGLYADGWLMGTTGAAVVNLPPAVPTGLSTVAVGSTQLTLNWQSSSPNLQQFIIFRFNGTSYVQIAALAGSARSYQDTGLSPSTTYKYAIRAVNGAGLYADGWLTGTTGAANQSATAPPAPTNLKATQVGTTQLELSWTHSSTTLQQFVIFRFNGTSYVQIATVAGNVRNYRDTGLSAGTTYSYAIRAVNAAGLTNDGWLMGTTATTSPSGAPAAPSNLSATQVGTNQLNLSWRTTTNNVDRIQIYRFNGANYVLIAELPPGTTTYQDKGLASKALYQYAIRAVGLSGQSADGWLSARTA